uniref:V-type proton ATPase subunit a n=1 Tax=Polytomella parva TaxID=51329 RepID=A0A7S0VDC6_9CHLO
MEGLSFKEKIFDFGFQNIDLWRSEEMQLVQLIIPAESAHDTIAALGEVGLLQFKDLNHDKSAFQRTYANQVKRCDEMARRLRYFKEQVDKAGLSSHIRAPQEGRYALDELEAKLEELEKELQDMNSNTEGLERTFNELSEFQTVLDKAQTFFTKAKSQARPEAFSYDLVGENADAPLLESQAEKTAKVGYLSGTIASDKINAFERLLFRATRGNMFLRQAAVGKIMDPVTNEKVDKTVFIIFFAGERARLKVKKICEAYSANMYPFPEEPSRQRQTLSEVSTRIRELQTTIEASARHRETVLQTIALNLDEWTLLVLKEKAIYHTLNKLNVDVTSKVLIGEAWVPTISKARVQDVLRQSAEQSSTQLYAIMQTIAHDDIPPTYYRTTKFTNAFQAIVEAYGVAKYREVNPSVLSIMTFPFLFAVMFGDVGHAILLIAFAAFLVIKENQLAKQDLGDMLSILFSGRYVILMMGFYSVFTGFMYNEFFSIPMRIFGQTHFRCHDVAGNLLINTVDPSKMIDPRDCAAVYGGKMILPVGAKPYDMGIDPIWHGRRTELSYLNSLKMKMSILMGVVHMDFGILNSLFNFVHFRDYLSLLCEFVPQIIFLNFIFGYLGLAIIIKWASGKLTDLYHVMIYMFLSPGSEVPLELFHGQGGIQAFLLLVAFFTVPWMLLPKPLILKKRHEALEKTQGQRLLSGVELSSSATGAAAHGHDDEENNRRPVAGGNGGGGGGGHGHGHGGHFDFGEIMIHQMIHAIEFILGAVSNTASYLRLWALSLAHSQLSAVFFDRILMMSVTMNNVVAMFIAFFVFACATLGVLMGMESLSAFLHALRLHWVEYMNKFYKGDGYKFTPFSFNELENENADAPNKNK